MIKDFAFSDRADLYVSIFAFSLIYIKGIRVLTSRDPSRPLATPHDPSRPPTTPCDHLRSLATARALSRPLATPRDPSRSLAIPRDSSRLLATSRDLSRPLEPYRDLRAQISAPTTADRRPTPDQKSPLSKLLGYPCATAKWSPNLHSNHRCPPPNP